MLRLSHPHHLLVSTTQSSDLIGEESMYPVCMNIFPDRIYVFKSYLNTRHEADTMVDEVFRSEERLEFSQALWMYTVGAAYAAHCEHILGMRL